MIDLNDMVKAGPDAFCVRHAGELYFNTTAITPQLAAATALLAHGYRFPGGVCDKAGCDCMVLLMKKVFPKAEVVPIRVTVMDHDYA